MSKNQTIQEFDENFFSSFAVPKVKDYSRLSSSPSRDQPCDSSYFEKHFPNLECDTPVKMRLPTADRESGDALPVANMENFLSSSSSSETTVNAEQRDSAEATSGKQHQNNREPFKIVPNDAAPAPAKAYGESQLIEGLEKLTMFAPKAPEERLSQRRRSEQKKKQEEDTKRRSAIPPNSGMTATINRARSISTKRAISREPKATATYDPPVPLSRHNSVSRTISAPITTSSGVVTRAMAAKAAENTSKPNTRRSVMPLKIVQKTPIVELKQEATGGGDRSRDRTRRTNTTGNSSVRRSVMPIKPVAASTPIAPPRRSASVNKTASSASKTTPKIRPIATANRSSTLRMNMVKPTAPPSSLADAQQKRMATRPHVPVTVTARTRQPIRVNPSTPSSTLKKPSLASSGQRPARQPIAVTRARSVDRGQQQPPNTTSTPSMGAKTSRTDLFNRLATPKVAATPTRVSHDGTSSSIRKSAVRPVPPYVYNVNKGMPSSGGLHGIRAPSKDRSTQRTDSSTEQLKQ